MKRSIAPTVISMSKHNFRYNHLCKPLQEKKQQKAMVKTAIDAKQLNADIMKQLKEELQNERKTAREKYATIKEEKHTQKKDKVKVQRLKFCK